MSGADPNIDEPGSGIEHILSCADRIDEIIILLSYGADPYQDNEREYNYALASDRYLHIAIYRIWGGMLENFPYLKTHRPKKHSDFQCIVEEFPILYLMHLDQFINSNVDFSEMPDSLKAFIKKIGLEELEIRLQ